MNCYSVQIRGRTVATVAADSRDAAQMLLSDAVMGTTYRDEYGIDGAVSRLSAAERQQLEAAFGELSFMERTERAA